ncbi:hypothetical protein MKW94_021033 [Papaver nudicaule]|uniref:Uncharacterized protein n=1 Tax=Papaver nudicaule TaxID=74823 RepID=A0AA41V6B0_PAPNU|nr:hypothetical protein [Papaver nudicaule]
MEQLPSNPLIRGFDHSTSDDIYSQRNVRRRTYESESWFTSKSLTEKKYRYRNRGSFVDYSKPMEQLDGGDGIYGSVTKDIQELCAKKWEIFNIIQKFDPSLCSHPFFSKGQSSGSGRGNCNVVPQVVIDLDSEEEIHDLGPVNAGTMETPGSQNVLGQSSGSSRGNCNVVPQVVIGLDGEEEIHHLGPINAGTMETPGSQNVLNTPSGNYAMVIADSDEGDVRTPSHVKQQQKRISTSESDNQGISPVKAQMSTSYNLQTLFSKKPVSEIPAKDVIASDHRKMKAEKEDKGVCSETVIEKSKGVYVGVQDDIMSDPGSGGSEDDNLDDIWMEMNLAIECSKDASSALGTVWEHTAEEKEDECEHSLVLKDDLGYVCRICGVIERSIEQIFDFQWGKGTKTTRTSYMSQFCTMKDSEQVEGSHFTIAKKSDQDFGVADISVHPRHMKQMKPHQIDGFNFLGRSLVCDSPGGCILAHTPGSGKTFLIITFMQSFLDKYPNARSLVVLPKGLLGTWKREIERWQVEEIPLYDLYTSKASSRAQQLDVLKQWVEHKGILFVGYKQFASIVSNSTSSTDAAACQCRNILLKDPSLLILDEGHTPRNEKTDVLNSLSQVQTPRKVVLSGTLFQNRVEEVFNILNLVRPKFLKLHTSKAVVSRVMSRVQRKQNNWTDTMFYDLVEKTLQNDQDFQAKVTMIQDLREMTGKVLHYYKGDFLDELPGLVDLTVLLTLSAKQKHAVEELRNLGKFKTKSKGSAVYVHPELEKFSESCATGEKERINVPMIDELLNKVGITDGVKAKFFFTILELSESVGEKLLVFSQYLLPLKFLERLVVKTRGWSLGKEIFVISGDSSQEQREISMERFNNSKDAKIFFGSIKACGEGISLVGASRLVILDVHLNPSVTRQAIGRAFRPGQTKKVYVYRLVAADSPEEEDHRTSFHKDLISKMWFEWNENCGYRDFGMEKVDTKDLDDSFWDRPSLGEDVKALYKRSVDPSAVLCFLVYWGVVNCLFLKRCEFSWI